MRHRALPGVILEWRTPSYPEFQGRTALGQQSSIPFHVTSADWLESDRLLAGIMTAFGSDTGAVDVGGWQCGNDPSCPPRHHVTRFLGQHWLDTPEKRVASTTRQQVLVG